MLINGNQWNGPTTIETDVCIVGTGIGGGTLAHCLAKAGVRFVAIEAGGLSKNASVGMENTGRPFVMPVTRAIELGGTSNLWHGVLGPLDRADFDKRSWIPHSGWPIRYEDLLPYYRKAAEIAGVERYELFDERTQSPELADQLASMPFDRSILQNKMFQQPLDIYRVKRKLKRIVEDSHTQHCIYNAVALEFEPAEVRTRVGQLRMRTTEGRDLAIKAGFFVAAAGALETPRLLLNSRKMNEQGAGNQNDQVGRYLMDHPMGNLLQVKFKNPLRAPIYSDTKSSPHMKLKTGLLFSRAVQEREGLPNHCFYIRPSFVEGINDDTERIKLSLLTFRDSRMTMADIARVVANPNIVAQVLAYKTWLRVTYKFGDLFFLTDQIPNPDSRVTLSNKRDANGYPIARVDWRITRDDLESMKRAFRILSTEAFSREHFTFTHKSWEETSWEERYSSAAHHVGTARMAANERSGVVDANLRVFGIDNLYVCDGSVFSTAGNVNISLTIMALAARLAEHLPPTR